MWLYIFGLILAVLMTHPCSAQSENQKIKAGVSEGFANLSSRGMSFQNDTKETLTDLKGIGAPKIIYVKTSKRRSRPDGCYLAEATPVDVPIASPEYAQKGRIWGYNTKYSFRLSSMTNKPWTLDEAAVYNSPDYSDVQKKSRESALTSMPTSAHYRNCLSIPLPRLLDHPNFILKSIAKVDPSGDVIRLEFDVQGNDLVEGAKLDIRISGSFDIDKNKSWSLVGRNETVYSSGTVRTTSSKFETVQMDNIHFLAKEHQLNRVVTNGAATRDDRVDYEHSPSLSPSVPESEFTLSAYGLPEPVGVTWEKPTPRYVWWMFGVGGFALLAFLCRLAVRRLYRVPMPTAA